MNQTRAPVHVRRIALSSILAAIPITAASCWLALQPPHLAVPHEGGAVLAHVELVEPGGTRARDVTLRLAGGRIAEIRASRASDVPTLECEVCVVLPGLIDLHVHHPPAVLAGQRELFSLLFLAHGVTSVRDTGIIDFSLRSHRDRVERGERAGPRVFDCGRILDSGPGRFPAARDVPDPAAARAAVADLAAEGAACVKVYGGVPEASLRVIQSDASARGMRVVAHAPRAVPFDRVANLEIQHLTGLVDQGAIVTDEAIASYAEHSRAAGTVHVPTLVVFARAARLAEASASLALDPALRLLPRLYRGLLWNPDRNPLLVRLDPDGRWSDLARQGALMARVVGALHARGVSVLAGSDTLNPLAVPGSALHEEIRLLAGAGLGPEAALAAATVRAAEALPEPRLGRLAVGAPADLAIFRADPTRDLAALDTLAAVIVRGRLFERATLLAAAERQRAHFEGAYGGVADTAVRAALAAARAAAGAEAEVP